MISGISNNLKLKFQRLKPPGCKDIGIRRFQCVADSIPFIIYLCLNNFKAHFQSYNKIHRKYMVSLDLVPFSNTFFDVSAFFGSKSVQV